MPSQFPIFDVAARIANDNPQAFFEYRHEVIGHVISRANTHGSLQLLQNRIDELRLTTANPMRSLNTLMEMLGGHLSTLSELLAHWQSVLEMERDDTEVQAALARLPAMLLDIEGVRNQIVDATGNPL